ncbi:MAG: hypothetical protein WCC48_13665 [Anaeromyxobacteraceae bacterium]
MEQARDAVRDEDSLIHFMQVLAVDFAADREEAAKSPPHFTAQGPRGWENGTVDAFLESAAAWVEDSRASRSFDNSDLSRPFHAVATFTDGAVVEATTPAPAWARRLVRLT